MKLLAVVASLLTSLVLVVPLSSAHAEEKAAEAPKMEKPDLAAGEARYTAVCAACHGAGGNSGSPAYPKLAQQHPEYLIKQLGEFKSGKRANPIMAGMAAGLSDGDMKNIAYWLASQKQKAGFAKSKDTLALGEALYRGGSADKKVAACAGCHSPNGAGIPAQYPRLAGQQTDYTVAQLTAFRDGVRQNSLQMTGVAAKLSDKEIKALADYVAGLH
jgi:cytochrome c553